eukprot:Opistho-1_new@74632
MNIQDLKLADYTYDLPDERIAKFPLEKRDESKLQVYQQGKITHTVFHKINEYLPKKTLLVFNNTKVIPARIHFQKSTGAVIQIFLLHPVAPTSVINLAMEVNDTCVWECMIGNRKRWKKEDILSKILTISGENVEVKASIFDFESNQVQLSWQVISENPENFTPKFVDIIQALGEIPLPPYLNREAEVADYAHVLCVDT